MTWDILICALTSRLGKLDTLVQHLQRQMNGRAIHILIEVDDGAMTIGEKRNRLLERSKADYVCFIDDDDWVSHDYVATIWEAMAAGPDCVTMEGSILWHGEWKHWSIAREHTGFTEDADSFYRPPNHLCPVKREIARRFSFPEKNHGEDAAYCIAMRDAGALQSEVHIAKELYFYEPSGGQ